MRSLTSSVVIFALASGIVGIVAFGCSADGSASIGGVDSSTSNTDPANTTPTSTSTSTPTSTPPSSGPPIATTDGGGTVGVDAGPPPPASGTVCTTANEQYSRTCGFCGTQTAICTTPDPDSGVDAGGDVDGGELLVVSDYSACTGEVAGGCTPGSSKTAACGNCGTQSLICQNNCTYASTVCAGEPKNACSPGSITNVSAGCGTDATGNQEFRQETCSATCSLGTASACGPFVNPHVIALAGTAKGIVTVPVDMEVTTGQSFTMYSFASCPDNDPTDITDNAPSDYVEVDNTTAKTATVTAYTTQTAGAAEVNTAIFTYAGKVPPQNDTDRLKCNFGVSDECIDGNAADNLCGADSDDYFAFLSQISIPAGASVLIYVGSDDGMTTGPVTLNIRTDTLK